MNTHLRPMRMSFKVDTNGHDFEVLAGAERLISRNHPVVLFECDVFNNTNYVEDCLSTLRISSKAAIVIFCSMTISAAV